MSIDNDIQYFIDMDSSVRMMYIVLRGLPNVILFGLPFFYSVADFSWEAVQLLS